MILLRHAEYHFNVHYHATREDPGLVDPALTAKGQAQAVEAARDLAGQRFSHILASPYWRSLETAEILAGHLGLGIVVERLVAERAFFMCDIGTPRSRLEARWPTVEFGALEEIWWPRESEDDAQLMARCASFRAAMARRDDWSRLLVVSHWGFIRGLTGQCVQNAERLRFDPTAD